ncbi:uncharacterized protein LOC121260951 [Juglans microcarpa x Juglans regia]|uniref:uncharacterized protein LOC121260951 n=1 Tax=Juglans microcarpa x Juglans regia TaxID=2249226 RepID=UPI001B7E919A|nr:uncharacterized protein LOC121260951 [Juglans microcarpa x Juglans regia]
MYRSASWSRVSDGDDYFKHGPSPSTKESPSMQRLTGSFESNNELPVYDPIAELAKKERARVKFAENAVHVIPFVLLLCATVLWFFSNPEVDVGIRGDSAAARIEGLTLEGEFDTDSDGTQTGALPIVDFGDIDSPKQLEGRKGPIKLALRSFK